MTNLFNGVLNDKFKHPLPNQEGAIKALARNNTTDNKTYNCEFDTSKLPLPIELLKHDASTSRRWSPAPIARH